jgi:hypothetical protein
MSTRQFYKNVYFLATSDSVNSSIASVAITGGLSVQKNVRFSQNLTVGNIMSTGITTGNINFTGALYQNNSPYVGSQWAGTNGNVLYYGSTGSTYVGINTSTPSFNLDVSGGARITTGITTGTILSTGLTTGNINFTGALYQNGVAYLGSQWSGTNGNLLYYGSTGSTYVGINTSTPSFNLDVSGGARITTGITTGTILASTGITTSNLFVTGNTTLGNWLFTNGTIANIVTNNVNYGIANTYSGSFIASNNTVTPTNVTGMSFTNGDTRSFSAKMTVSIIRSAGGNLFATFTLDGTQTDSGWVLFTSYDGDVSGVDFSITSLGVMQYTSTNITNFTSNTFRYSVTQITNTGTYNTLLNPTVGSYVVDGLSSTNFISTNFSSSNFSVTNFSIGNLSADTINYGIANTFSGTFFATVNGSPVSVTQLIFNSTNIVSFTINMTVSTSTLFESFLLEGIQTSTGWVILSTSQGDTTGVVFSINSSTGQVNYTSASVATFRFVVTQTSKTGTYTSLAITTVGNYIMNSISTGTLFVGNVTVGGNLIPDTNITRDIGSSTNRWRDIYLSGNTIDLGGTLISATNGGTAIAFGSTIITTTTVGNIGSTIKNLSSDSISTGTINASVGITSGSILSTGLTTGNINFTGSLFQNGLAYLGSQWTTTSGNVSYTSGSVVSSNFVATNITVSSLFISSGNLNMSGGNLNMTGGNINVNSTINSSVVSVGNLFSVNTSLGNLTSATGTFANKVGGSQTVGSLFISSGNLNMSGGNLNMTGGNVNISGSNFNLSTPSGLIIGGGNITVNSLLVSNGNLNISSGALNVSGNISSASTISGNVFTGGSLQISGTISSGTLRGTDLFLTGTLTTVNITTQNLLVTTNSSTIGSLLVSGGNLNMTGGNLNISGGSINISGGALNVSGNVSSASTISALVFTGGSLQISGTISSSNFVTTGITTSSLFISSGSLNVSGGSLNMTGGNVNISGANFNLSTPSGVIIAGGNVTINNLLISRGTVLMSNFMNTSGNMLSGNSVGNRLTTDIKVMNKRIRTSRANALNCASTFTIKSLPNNLNWWGVCWSPELGLFAAVANNSSNNNIFISSPNGIDWTTGTGFTGLSTSSYYSICWSSELGLFVAVNANGSNNTTWIVTSTNGTTWTQQTGLSSSSGWVGVCWSPEMSIFVAVGNGNTATSTNGTTWIVTSNGALSGRRVCWSPELGLFVAANLVGFMYSSNGTSWTSVTIGSGLVNCTSVCWSPELYLFVGISFDSSSSVITSRDGINWNIINTGLTATSPIDICWSPELSMFLITSVTTSVIWTSFDGVKWTSRSIPTTAGQVGVCWSPELSIFCSPAQSNQVITSNYGLPTNRNTISAVISQMTVTSSGNVGINTISPANTLDVNGTARIASTSGNNLSLVSSNASTSATLTLTTPTLTGYIGLGGASVSVTNYVNNLFYQSPNNHIWNYNTTSVMSLTNSGTLTLIGDIGAFGSISDSRLKTNVNKINSGLSIVNELNPVTFNWKDDIFNENYAGKNDSGFIAQEVELLLPHAVGEYTNVQTDFKYKNMRHERIIPYLVSAIQELTNRIKLLENFTKVPQI